MPNPTVPTLERAILVGVDYPTAQHWDINASLDELATLARTAGALPLQRVLQRRPHPDPHTYLGKGKLQELIALRDTLDYTLVLFDDELAPAQQRALEAALQVKVIDRTALILDIFAQRARTREGALQVALAQHEYLLPRLAGQWSHLERMEGAIGARGPGETQLETDRRLIRSHIGRLKRRLQHLRQHREQYRRRRRRAGIPIVALIGYTNAGKSTLLNALTGADVRSHDRLFETLDPITRRYRLDSQHSVLITDTVGFLQKLPAQLVAAFRATLEELNDAHLLLHVVDIAHPDAAEQSQTVEDTLVQLDLATRPRLTAFNKLDRLVPAEAASCGIAPTLPTLSAEIAAARPDAILISATKGWGLDQLRGRIASALAGGAERAAPAAPATFATAPPAPVQSRVS